MATLCKDARIVANVLAAGRLNAWRKGDRVVVTRGGHKGEHGRIYDIRYNTHDNLIAVTTLDTGMLFYGPVERLPNG